VINEFSQAFDTPDARAIVDALWSSWPVVSTLRPADVGMADTPERAIGFIKTVQQLSDAGFVSYEAFVVGMAGPRVVEATLTARGRALLGMWMNAEREPQIARRA